MKNYFHIILPLIVVIISCENSTEPSPSTPNPDPNNNNNGIKEVVIDTTDLYYLPKDTGGTHQAHPLGTTSAGFGYYIYKPGGYTDDGPEYPLILFLHGWGERGDSSNDEKVLDNILRHGPPKLIRSGQWKPAYPFIVVSPQLAPEIWSPYDVHDFLDYIIEHYQINTIRIYLTGLSLGGGGCWLYAGAIEDHYAAAIVPISASGSESHIDNLRDVPIWAFHGENDDLVNAFENFGSVPMVESINRTNPPLRAKVTVYPNVGHDAWTITYNGAGMARSYWYNNYNMNIYEWMLQFKKDQTYESEAVIEEYSLQKR